MAKIEATLKKNQKNRCFTTISHPLTKFFVISFLVQDTMLVPFYVLYNFEINAFELYKATLHSK